MNTDPTSREEYRILNRALKALRENFIAGDLSGFTSHADLAAAIRAMERRMFDLVATVR